MKKINLLMFCLLASTLIVQAQTKPMKEVKNVIQEFNDAIGSHNVTKLEELLHKDFRVIANQFKGGEDALILSRETYLKMIGGKQIGGTRYEVEIKNVSLFDHTASVEVSLNSKASNMHVYFILIKSKSGAWKIVSDTPVIVANKD